VSVSWNDEVRWAEPLGGTISWIRPSEEEVAMPSRMQTPAHVESSARRGTLDGFVEAASRTHGLGITELAPLTTVFVRTQNSVYRLDVLDPPRRAVMVQGGAFFGQPTRAWLNGSSFGGTCLKVGWIGVSLHLEFSVDDGLILTSRVVSVDVQGEGNGRVC
jgi:hypothetical protein